MERMVISKRALYLAAEKAFLVLALLLFSRAFVPLFESLGAIGSMLQAGLYAAVFGMIALLIIRHLGRFLYVALRDWLLLLIVAYVCASVIWSYAPSETLKSLPVFLGATALGIYLAARFDLRAQVRMLMWMLVLATFMSLFFGLFLPVGVMTDTSNAGAWRGIYSQKNDLGRFMALAIVVLGLSVSRKGWARGAAGRAAWGVAWATVAIAGGLLLLSRSATSLGTLIILILLVPLYRVLQLRRSSLMPVLLAGGSLIIIAAGLLAATNAELIISIVGKDSTLTGRIPLWAAVWQKIAERPWLGYGYNAFWLGANSEAADVWLTNRWLPNHAHNGFLDLWLELGVFGLLLVIFHLAGSAVRSVRYASRTPTLIGLWPLVLLTILLLYNFNYSVLVSQSVFFWAVYLGTSLRIRLELGQVPATRERAATAARLDPLPEAGAG